MKRILPMLISLLLVLTGCGGNTSDGYQQITQEEAKEMMDTQEVIVLDVREQDEYDSGHIPGAVLLPVGTIDEDTAAEAIPKRIPRCWSTAAAGTAAKLPPPRWPNWAIPISTNSAGSTPGPMKLSHKLGNDRRKHEHAPQNLHFLFKEYGIG